MKRAILGCSQFPELSFDMFLGHQSSTSTYTHLIFSPNKISSSIMKIWYRLRCASSPKPDYNMPEVLSTNLSAETKLPVYGSPCSWSLEATASCLNFRTHHLKQASWYNWPRWGVLRFSVNLKINRVIIEGIQWRISEDSWASYLEMPLDAL